MAISFHTFFDYVFAGRAQMPEAPTGITLSADAKAKMDARHTQAQDDKRAAFRFITDNKSLSLLFRTMLRAQNSVGLETLLYGNNTEILSHAYSSQEYPMPAEDVIKKRFKDLDDNYGYFTNDKDAIHTFSILFKASKLIADYVENNHMYADVLAYEQAYKMMVLFKPNPKTPCVTIDHFIKMHGMNFSKPIHDILVLGIPKNIPPLKHLDEWRALLRKHGVSILSLFQQAPAIEKWLETRSPLTFTLDTIKEAAAQITYQKAAVNPELAQLCVQYHVSEKAFNTCLTIKPKSSDLLPGVLIDGSTLEHPGYYLVKLPVGDPRAFILGHITNCCQSIGGNSEKCVIDGMTREKNGFYVLLKSKSQKPSHDPMEQGKINYNDYDIVGQGYAWLSKLNNLTLDSWENLATTRDNPVIYDLLPKFAEQCFEKMPTIGRVTIGTGGKTPDAYSEKIRHPERMAEGYAYGDASDQALIATNPILLQHTAAINKALRAKGIKISCHLFSMCQVEWFHSLLNNDNAANYQQTLGHSLYKKLLGLAANYPNLLGCMIQLLESGRLSKAMVATLSQHAPGSEAQTIAVLSLINLYQENDSLITETICEFISKHGKLAQEITDALSILHKANPALITDERCKLLSKHAVHAKKIATGWSILYTTSPTLLTKENERLLARNATRAEELGDGISILYKVNPALLTKTNCKWLSHPKSIYLTKQIAYGLSTLYITSPTLMTTQLCKLLIDNARNAPCIAAGLASLYKMEPTLLTKDNIRRLVREAEHSDRNNNKYKLSDDLCQLFDDHIQFLLNTSEECFHLIQTPDLRLGCLAILKQYPALITRDNFKILVSTGRELDTFLQSISMLMRLNPTAITNDIFRLLAQPKYVRRAPTVAFVAGDIYKDSPSLITSKNIALLTQNNEEAYELRDILLLLYKTNPTLASDENSDLLSQCSSHIGWMSKGLSLLYKTNPALVTDEHFKLLVKNASKAREIFKALDQETPFITDDLFKEIVARHARPDTPPKKSRDLGFFDASQNENKPTLKHEQGSLNPIKSQWV